MLKQLTVYLLAVTVAKLALAGGEYGSFVEFDDFRRAPGEYLHKTIRTTAIDVRFDLQRWPDGRWGLSLGPGLDAKLMPRKVNFFLSPDFADKVRTEIPIGASVSLSFRAQIGDATIGSAHYWVGEIQEIEFRYQVDPAANYLTRRFQDNRLEAARRARVVVHPKEEPPAAVAPRQDQQVQSAGEGGSVGGERGADQPMSAHERALRDQLQSLHAQYAEWREYDARMCSSWGTKVGNTYLPPDQVDSTACLTIQENLERLKRDIVQLNSEVAGISR